MVSQHLRPRNELGLLANFSGMDFDVLPSLVFTSTDDCGGGGGDFWKHLCGRWKMDEESCEMKRVFILSQMLRAGFLGCSTVGRYCMPLRQEMHRCDSKSW